jgi:hypothetical protein
VNLKKVEIRNLLKFYFSSPPPGFKDATRSLCSSLANHNMYNGLEFPRSLYLLLKINFHHSQNLLSPRFQSGRPFNNTHNLISSLLQDGQPSQSLNTKSRFAGSAKLHDRQPHLDQSLHSPFHTLLLNPNRLRYPRLHYRLLHPHQPRSPRDKQSQQLPRFSIDSAATQLHIIETPRGDSGYDLRGLS